MNFKFSNFVLLAFVLMVSASTVFAEGDFVTGGGGVNCSGKIIGKTVVSNPNFGQIDFDSHPSPYSDANKVTDLSIVGLAEGLAPADRYLAACLDSSTSDPAVADEFSVKGYAWNTNLGFFSFFCKDGKNQGKDCGAFDYGVKVGAADVNGKRLLSGNAWNSSFGYLQFAGSGLPFEQVVGPNMLSGANGVQPWPNTDITIGGVTYNIALKSVGGITAVIGVDGGFAPIDAGSSLDFGGVTIEVVNAMTKADGGLAVFNVKKQIESVEYGVTADATGKLSGWAWTEAKVWVNMAGATIQIPGKELEKEAEGPCANKPFVCLEVTDPEEPLNKVLSGDNGTGGIKISMDEVKVANGVDFYEIHLYLKNANGVDPMDFGTYSIGNIDFTWKDTVKINQQYGGSPAGIGLNTIESPWTQGKGGVIYKPISVKLADFENKGNGHYVLKNTIRSYAPTTDMNISYTTSMKPNVAFKNETFFNAMSGLGDGLTPPVLKEANNLILSKINVPVTEIATGKAPILPKGIEYPPVVYPNGKDGLSLQFRPAVEVSTLFSGNNSDSITGYRSIPFDFSVGGKKDSKLNASPTVEFKLDYDEELTVATCQDNGEKVPSGGFKIAFADNENSSRVVNVDSPFSDNYQAVATLLGYDDVSDEEKAKIEKPCSQASGPNLYSIVRYKIDGKEVSYYSNKLPRIVSTIANPVAVVHGNLYAAKAFSPSAAAETQETGTKSVNIVRDGVYENIASKLGVVLERGANAGLPNSKECLVGWQQPDSCSGASTKTVDGTSVTVYKNTDVHIDLESPDAYSDNQTIVVMNGNIFIDSDIYKGASSTDKMQIISLRPYSSGCNKGNIYIKSNVKNINANIFTDCSVFSYVDKNKIDTSADGGGLYQWGSFSEMVDALSSQLRILGSIASKNTVGGADLDKDEDNPKTYLLDGFRAWEVKTLPSGQRLKIQAYDLNYLRLFKLSIQKDELGRPIDQFCKKGLTLEEMLQIKQNAAGEDVPAVFGDDGSECNGIDALTLFDGENGDLVAPVDETALAKGLETGKYDPVYVIFSASTSPLFQR